MKWRGKGFTQKQIWSTRKSTIRERERSGIHESCVASIKNVIDSAFAMYNAKAPVPERSLLWTHVGKTINTIANRRSVSTSGSFGDTADTTRRLGDSGQKAHQRTATGHISPSALSSTIKSDILMKLSVHNDVKNFFHFNIWNHFNCPQWWYHNFSQKAFDHLNQDWGYPFYALHDSARRL